jgi:hypothetical protein
MSFHGPFGGVLVVVSYANLFDYMEKTFPPKSSLAFEGKFPSTLCVCPEEIQRGTKFFLISPVINTACKAGKAIKLEICSSTRS